MPRDCVRCVHNYSMAVSAQAVLRPFFVSITSICVLSCSPTPRRDRVHFERQLTIRLARKREAGEMGSLANPFFESTFIQQAISSSMQCRILVSVEQSIHILSSRTDTIERRKKEGVKAPCAVLSPAHCTPSLLSFPELSWVRSSRELSFFSSLPTSSCFWSAWKPVRFCCLTLSVWKGDKEDIKPLRSVVLFGHSMGFFYKVCVCFSSLKANRGG